MRPAEKRLNQMNRLTDMLHFPPAVNAGATLNVLLTIAATWYVEPRLPGLAGPHILLWIGLILILNLLPVVLLRLSMNPATQFPQLQQMDFIRDQHKFSDWVYLAASANMAFWISLAWTLCALHHTTATLGALEVFAFLVTFSPVLFRKALSSFRA